MKILLLSSAKSDLTEVLHSCGAQIDMMSVSEAIGLDMSVYDTFVVLGSGGVINARVRERLENEREKGKRFFLEAPGSFMGIYSADPANTTRSRLVYVEQEGALIPGLQTGDLLDDEANRMMQPWFAIEGYKPILVYREHIIAHTHLNASAEEIIEGSKCGLWMVGDNVMMTSFVLHNWNRARFAPRGAWDKLIRFIVKWITGNEPEKMPEPILRYGTDEDITDEAVFEKCRRDAIERGMNWLRSFLVDDGCGGIKEGLRHNIDPEGRQAIASTIRTDCSGEAAGAFKMYAKVYGCDHSWTVGKNIEDFIYGPMQVKGGLFDGLMRWTETAWQVCYQDDAARAILPSIYSALFLGDDSAMPSVCRALDFLVRTTAKDGCRTWRTDMPGMTEESVRALGEAEQGNHSAHYNAFYHASLVLAYKQCGKREYLETAQKGLETLMALYPDTVREQSETEEMCRLVLPLAALYDVTKEEKHREMLYRVVADLEKHKHPSGGFCEWDTGYRAACSRESAGECSLLTENGDPVADLLYSVNWLPIGFAYAYYATGDEKFKNLWHDIVGFFLKSQIFSSDALTDGSWCRGFDMDLGEAYGCPHDVGWAANASESGWTDAEILMGMMMPEILS